MNKIKNKIENLYNDYPEKFFIAISIIILFFFFIIIGIITINYSNNNTINDDVNNYIKLDVKSSKCSYYVGRMVKDVKIGESPAFIKKRLESVGIRSINNVVDISNYVKIGFNALQIKEIRLGLLNNIKVSKYSKKKLSWKKMREIRLELMEEKKLSVFSLIKRKLKKL